jgi:hypothetical protein
MSDLKGTLAEFARRISPGAQSRVQCDYFLR